MYTRDELWSSDTEDWARWLEYIQVHVDYDDGEWDGQRAGSDVEGQVQQKDLHIHIHTVAGDVDFLLIKCTN